MRLQAIAPNFPGWSFGETFAKLDSARDLVGGDLAAAVQDDLFGCTQDIWHHHAANNIIPIWTWNANHYYVGDLRMLADCVFYLIGIHLVTAPIDHQTLTAAERHITIRIYTSQIPCQIEAVTEIFLGRGYV